MLKTVLSFCIFIFAHQAFATQKSFMAFSKKTGIAIIQSTDERGFVSFAKCYLNEKLLQSSVYDALQAINASEGLDSSYIDSCSTETAQVYLGGDMEVNAFNRRFMMALEQNAATMPFMVKQRDKTLLKNLSQKLAQFAALAFVFPFQNWLSGNNLYNMNSGTARMGRVLGWVGLGAAIVSLGVDAYVISATKMEDRSLEALWGEMIDAANKGAELSASPPLNTELINLIEESHDEGSLIILLYNSLEEASRTQMVLEA